MSTGNLWEIEDRCKEEGFLCVCGVDEAGRGPLAGPVCAAAVILPEHLEIPGLGIEPAPSWMLVRFAALAAHFSNCH